VAGCGSSGPTATPPAPPDTDSPPTVEPLTPDPGLGSEAPTDAPEPTEDEPGPTDEPEPTEDEPDPTTAGSGGSLADCTGTDENRDDFYGPIAAAVDWPLYCPNLPSGWHVESGQFRLASGGRMEISYRGPNGAGLRLQEGAFCESGGCMPSGEQVGTTSFGDQEGTLYRVDDDGWAVEVDGGEEISWLLVLSGVDERRARTFAADLVRLD